MTCRWPLKALAFAVYAALCGNWSSLFDLTGSIAASFSSKQLPGFCADAGLTTKIPEGTASPTVRDFFKIPSTRARFRRGSACSGAGMGAGMAAGTGGAMGAAMGAATGTATGAATGTGTGMGTGMGTGATTGAATRTGFVFFAGFFRTTGATTSTLEFGF